MAVVIKFVLTGPSIKSSLKILNKTPWARGKVEGLYLQNSRSVF
ncbi:MAG: VF530 family DNA-binding protein [Candidatus Thiodiazotropha sp. (ex Codakia rugifera)]|nr:VF530 family DNA-binding protein [Candidatus Thiodiazotropha sp. (ex Codakia rugifera)]